MRQGGKTPAVDISNMCYSSHAKRTQDFGMSVTEADDMEREHEAARAAVRDLRETITTADPETLRLLITDARSHNGWRDTPVSDETLRALYDIAKMGPTSMNQQPMRLLFVRSAEAKAKLEPFLSEGNRAKTMAAPVVAIIGYDLAFYERLPEVFPQRPNAKDNFVGKPALIEDHAFRNGTLQAAYLMLAARAVGLDVGPMSGFDKAKVNETFFGGTTVKTNFLCSLGYADETKIFRRLPRLSFDDVAKIL